MGRSNKKHIQETGDQDPVRWVLELKIDGVAASLVYDSGVLTRGATRGNGVVGDDITHNVRTVKAIPLRLGLQNPPPQIEVRGEVFMENSALLRSTSCRPLKVFLLLQTLVMSPLAAFDYSIPKNAALVHYVFFATESAM